MYAPVASGVSERVLYLNSISIITFHGRGGEDEKRRLALGPGVLPKSCRTTQETIMGKISSDCDNMQVQLRKVQLPSAKPDKLGFWRVVPQAVR